MLGHEGVISKLVMIAREQLPGVIERLTAELRLPPGTIRTPAAEAIHPTYVDFVPLGMFPTLMVTVEDTEVRNATRLISADGIWNEYEFRYPLRVLVYTTGVDGQHDSAELERMRLMQALRTLILQYPVLHDRAGESAQIIPESIRENFTGGQYDDNNQLLLEAYLRFEVKTTERLQIAPEPAAAVTLHHVESLL